ncbi:bacteriophytochrome (light-regulated signal transduction histidine kinase) [Xenococcus sp. PCC 7305]|uniref:ATP-binding protein n=1 Tax=Xenococcus sp. PCC 7305 TaxID=102125 RepID=UPI0002AC74C8|nr:ATP-binding protein [Xenococcus sp. PCC 7305]ELS05233.1 bacteriophytochrome (light-regulated signal transduction histidine kinase) [Xenococcus sp. PCC 7305]
MSSELNSLEFLSSITTDVDLANCYLAEREALCDREPIHIPNLIQPHGVLLAVSATEYQILQVSLNTAEILGIESQKLLGRSLSEFLGEEQVTAIKSCLSEDFDNINPLPIQINRDGLTTSFDGIVHRNQEIIILELEQTQPSEEVDFFNFYKLVKSPVNKLQSTNTLEELCNAIAKEVRQITGFDRVMVYRFDQDDAGTVIAEAKTAELEPFLGLHYPASDIPKQAKYLYTLNFLRLIPDAAYEPVGLIPKLNPLTNKPLDMSMSVLRSVSPLHTEYLQNMGVAASMSISVLKNKQLWGLIACHHNSQKKVPYEIRTVCEFIGQIASFELAAKEANQNLDYKMKLKSIQSQFVATISQAEELVTGLTQNPQELLDLVGAVGVALSFGKDLTLIGDTPDKEFITKMLSWLENQFTEEVIYNTNSLGQIYPAAKSYKTVASGLLALLISRVPKTFIIWFRPEVIQTVDWGGNPHKPVELDEEGTVKMSPRKSFAKWQETVHLKSLPWKACEIEAALELRSSIIGIVLRKADELSQVNQELTRSNIELDAFAYIASHDLKEPLRGIYNYSSFLLEDYGEILDPAGQDKLHTLMRLTRRMEDLIESLLHYSRLGRAELQMLPVDLSTLVAGVLDVIKASARDTQVQFKIPRPLPIINCDRTQVNELFTNLISNGIKYNQATEKIIEIGYLDSDHPIVIKKMGEYPDNTPEKTIFYVSDNGIGIRERHLESIFRIFKRLHGQKKYGGGTGAGLTIAKKIVERHGGEIWVKSVYQEGSTFYFTLQ